MALTNLQKQTNRITKLKTLEQVRAYWKGKSNPLRIKDAPKCRIPGVSKDYFERQYHAWRLRGSPCPFEALIPAIRYDEFDQPVDIVFCSVGYFDFDENPITVETYNALNIGYEAIKLKEKDSEFEASMAVSREMLVETGAKLMAYINQLRKGDKFSTIAGVGPSFASERYSQSISDMETLIAKLTAITTAPDPETEVVEAPANDGTYTAAEVLATPLTVEEPPRVHIRKELWRRFKAFFGYA